MNHRKAAFGFCITLGIIVGAFLSIVTGENLIGALLVGAILGALVVVAIDSVISRRRTSVVPYDHVDEHHHVSNPGHHQPPEAQLRHIQDGHIDQFMPFHPGKTH
ncbi:MAG: hypothetical protein ACXVDN_12165 [Ktedonobacteraceae bacterium]